MSPTLEQLAHDLQRGATTSRALVEDCLARIDDSAGEGARTFLSVAHASARACADAMDALRAQGAAPSVGHDTRRPVQPLPKARHHYVGAMLGEGPAHPATQLIGDGLVLADSAAGHHRSDALRVPFGPGDGVLLPGLHHLQLVNHPEVYRHLARWLA